MYILLLLIKCLEDISLSEENIYLENICNDNIFVADTKRERFFKTLSCF